MQKKGRAKGGLNMPRFVEIEKMLSVAIVAKAITDWRELIAEKAWLSNRVHALKNFVELRQFFKGDWCAMLMIFMELNPSDILKRLEEELEDAKKKEAKKK